MNNGLLVDPHDHKAIADALLKLLADKNLWSECRKSGWRNIHLFSWPEHCRTYLTRVAACRMRHPQWQADTPTDDIVNENSLGDSLKDFQGLSLRLSLDGPAHLEKVIAEKEEQVKKMVNKVKKPETEEKGQQQSESAANIASKYPLLRRRRRLFVIAIDSYDSKGMPTKTMIQVIQEVFKAVKSDSQMSRISGFALSTAMPISETLELLKSGKIQAKDFDALICSSGAELYYPGTQSSEGDGKCLPDPDYVAHIDYRWGHDGIKRTIEKLMNNQELEKSPTRVVEDDLKSSNEHCVSFFIKDPNKVCIYCILEHIWC